MKKIKFIILLFIMALLCAGCDIIYASTTRDIRHSGFNLSGQELLCPSLLSSEGGKEKLKYLLSNTGITTDGKIYNLSYSQTFSNDLNCKLSDFQHKVESIFDSAAFRASDGKIYYYSSSDDHAAFSLVTQTDDNYSLYYLMLSDRAILKVVTADSNSNSYYVLKTDGNVYNYIVDKNNGVARVIASSVVYGKHNYNGKIIDFNYAGKSGSTFIRTENKIYRMIISNREMCTKYADITCEYEMREDEYLTKNIDKILGYSGSFLITNYGKEFTVMG